MEQVVNTLKNVADASEPPSLCGGVLLFTMNCEYIANLLKHVRIARFSLDVFSDFTQGSGPTGYLVLEDVVYPSENEEKS